MVTLAGPTHVSRTGVTILANAGLYNLVAGSEAAYVQTATTLANDYIRLTSLRATLRDQRHERARQARDLRAVAAVYQRSVSHDTMTLASHSPRS